MESNKSQVALSLVGHNKYFPLIVLKYDWWKTNFTFGCHLSSCGSPIIHSRFITGCAKRAKKEVDYLSRLDLSTEEVVVVVVVVEVEAVVA